MLAGWSSGSKYPLLGSVRASAQMVTYEAALGLSVATVVLRQPARCRTNGIVVAQADASSELEPHRHRRRAVRHLPHRRHRRARTGRRSTSSRPSRSSSAASTPSTRSIRFALFFLAEFMNTVTMSAIIVTLFLGGPAGPIARRPGLAVADRLVLRQADRLPVRVRVVPGHAAPVPLRPADGPRLEGADPARLRLAAAAHRAAASASDEDWNRGRWSSAVALVVAARRAAACSSLALRVSAAQPRSSKGRSF